jgi:two-component system sensor histidine kinase PilS (NtrC family)
MAVAPRSQFLRWLTHIRLVGISLVLAVEWMIRWLVPQSALRLAVFATAISVWYALAVLYIFLPLWSKQYRRQAIVQIFTDAFLITLIVYSTGLTESSLTTLFALLIFAAATVLERQELYLLAFISAGLYTGAILITKAGLIASTWNVAPNSEEIQISVGLNLMAWVVGAFLGARLSRPLIATERELQEKTEALESLRALHQDVVRSMTGGLIATKLDGTITLVNGSARRILERRDDLTGHQVETIFDASTVAKVPSRCELKIEAEGRQKDIGLTVTQLLDGSRNAIGRLYHFQDLTELRTLERELQAREKMAALGRMAAGIAHEIRNPLTAIAGSVKLLQTGSTISEGDQQILKIVLRESERLNRLVTDFLAYARERPLQLQPVELGQLLKDMLALVRSDPRCAAIEVVASFEPGNLWVMADTDRLSQVIWNLCDNALKAMRAPGRLEVTCTNEKDKVRMVIADSGCGLKPGTEQTIFEPFHSGFKKGTGLGLATAYAVVEAHGGRIWAENRPGGGAVFSIELRSAAEPRTAATASSRSQMRAAGK